MALPTFLLDINELDESLDEEGDFLMVLVVITIVAILLFFVGFFYDMYGRKNACFA